MAVTPSLSGFAPFHRNVANLDLMMNQSTSILGFVLALLVVVSTLVQAGEANAPDQARLYRRLDRLAALGVGLQGQQSPQVAGSPTQEKGSSLPSPYGLTPEQYQAQIDQHNAQAMAQLGQHIEDIKSQCGGKLPDLPQVGMSDEAFRQCTLHAHYGGIRQIVVSEAAGVPLRLYVFSSERAHKVYSIGGVVTRIEP